MTQSEPEKSEGDTEPEPKLPEEVTETRSLRWQSLIFIQRLRA